MDHAAVQPGTHPSAGAHAPRPDLAAAVRGIAGPAVVLIGLRAAMPVVSWLAFRVYNMVSPFPAKDAPSDEVMAALDARRGLDTALNGLEGLLGLVALIVFWIWLARVYAWIRATRGPTKYSTGWAIGSWFVPIANLFVPPMAISDAVKKGANGESGGLVPVFWIAWLVALGATVAEAMMNAIAESPQLSISDFRFLFDNARAFYWVGFVAQVVAWGSLLVIVKTVTKHADPRPAV